MLYTYCYIYGAHLARYFFDFIVVWVRQYLIIVTVFHIARPIVFVLKSESESYVLSQLKVHYHLINSTNENLIEYYLIQKQMVS